MADFSAVAGACLSVQRMLTAQFNLTQPLGANTRTKVVLARTADLDPNRLTEAIGSPALALFLYRVDFNKAMRAAWSAVGYRDDRAHLPLDLHFLLTPFGDNAEFEYRILGRALEAIETMPILSGPLLQPGTDWAADEAVQLVMEDISTEAIMRTFDSLPIDYRLSVPYIARIVRIDSRVANVDPRVMTRVAGMIPEPTP